MDRREFVRAMSAAALAGGFTISPEECLAALLRQETPVAGGASDARPYGPPFDSPPVLQNPSANAVTVFVCVSAITTAWVEYGPTKALGATEHAAVHGLRSLSGEVHRIRLTGLRPGTRYFYRVVLCRIDFKGAYKILRHEQVSSPIYSFTTLDDGDGATASFNVINDTHENAQTLRGVTGLVAQHEAGLTFWNGDIFNDVRSDPQIVDQMMRPAGVETGLAFAARAPFCFVNGNHDVRGIHARRLDRYVEVPNAERHYLLRHGPLAMIVLDTGEDKPDEAPGYAGLGEFAAYRDRQRHWLMTAVRSPQFRRAAFRVVIQHIPMFGPGSSEDARAKWHPVLAEADVDLIICGHTHSFAYHPPDGTHSYAQIIGGGPDPLGATFMHVEADRRRMSVRVLNLAGQQTAIQEFARTP